MVKKRQTVSGFFFGLQPGTLTMTHTKTKRSFKLFPSVNLIAKSWMCLHGQNSTAFFGHHQTDDAVWWDSSTTHHQLQNWCHREMDSRNTSRPWFYVRASAARAWMKDESIIKVHT